MFVSKMFAWFLIGAITMVVVAFWDAGTTEQRRDVYLSQLNDDDSTPALLRRDYLIRHAIYSSVGISWIVLGGLLFSTEINGCVKNIRSSAR